MTQRLTGIDALRGFAVIGIILMNVFFFSMPGGAYFNPRSWGGMEPVNLSLWSVSFVFIEDKMRGLFALLFGASVCLMLRKGGGAKPWLQYYSRMVWLLLIGFAHAILLANNEILRLYAICGLFLAPLSLLSVRWLVGLSLALLAVHMAAGSYIGYGWIKAYFNVASGQTSAEVLRPMELALGADPGVLQAQIDRHLGSYESIIKARLPKPKALGFVAIVMLPVTLSTMLLGMALFKAGALTGAWTSKAYKRAAFISFAIATPPLVALAIWAFQSNFSAVVIAFNAFVWSAPFDLLMTFGWAMLMVRLLASPRLGTLHQYLAAAGRMALSNYILTSLILSFIFFGYGLGLYSSISRAEAYLFACIPAAVILLWSKPWLDHFRYGPAEWLWRSLTRFKLQPIKGAAR